MKKLIVIAMVCLITNVSFAQKKRGQRNEKAEHKMERVEQFTPEQHAELKTKKMTLLLDLTNAQQKEILALHTQLAKDHKAKRETMKERKKEGHKLTSEERFEMMSKRIDRQIEVQKQFKSILDNDQYKLWKLHLATKEKGKKPFKRKNNKV